MSGYRFNQAPPAVALNDGEPVIDGGNATTNYLVQFDNGDAQNAGQMNPVVLNFGAST